MKYSIVLPFLATTVLAAPVEQRQAACNVPTTFPSTSNSKLPDPFKFFDGRKVETKADFECRNKEVNAAVQAQELGILPPKPATVTASGTSSLSITASEGGKSVSFSVSIKKPSGSGPFPAIIAYGGASIPVPAGVATITFNNDQIGAQQGGNSRGQGKFFDLYGSGHSAGALTAWAWGVDRVIDALELVDTGINPKKVGVTGCSRNGKGAFVAAALVPRIALGLPQESGSGGAACWRISDSEKAAGKNIQTSGQIIGENVWFSKNFNTFATKSSTTATDHHQLAGLVAPRGLLVIENEIDWLGPVSTTACMKAGRLIYKALGVPDNMGFTGSGNHNHCSFPSNQQAELTAFINKFLLDKSDSTANIEKGPAADVSKYIDWTTPTLT
ncbi:carbohydrate esterase family 15 protein [Aaosphaeria arxii CBS 175.79]|uniref:(4-O-methyl)-D-glucuronate--lignin esterase n=1 Tax=Aaosphaeria arxii CBS 175.79 TaxID=1450172 RepID=A0A6A5XHH4_9PLEO|nr:carbohydrate esterase family 15 protein [Aaosphaeria arxii CBS 175.79]KAF2012725.1 carbohydrate esterase family 15 protein [Aaosphaeria arxii CBS 175.79]